MKIYQDKVIVAVDTGYGNIKTANHCFRTGITAYDSEPLFTKDMLVYDGKYYLIGEGHKEFLPEKQLDEDYFLLTLVAIAKELKTAGKTYWSDIARRTGRSKYVCGWFCGLLSDLDQRILKLLLEGKT